LPDIDGHEVLRRLRADPQSASIPVIAISADATRGQIDRLMKAGASVYLTKPLDVAKFTTCSTPPSWRALKKALSAVSYCRSNSAADPLLCPTRKLPLDCRARTA
jgi:CheY-like chemotaxis protein